MRRELRAHRDLLDRRRGRGRPRGLEGGHAHGTHDLSVAGRFDGEDRIAGVDRTAEARRALDGHDVAHLRRAEQPRDARHQILPEGGGGAEDVGEGAGQRDQLRRQHRRERVLVGRVLHGQHAAHARKARGLRRDGRGIDPAHRDADLGAGNTTGAGDALGGAHVELRAVVLGDDQDLPAHSSPFFLSASTSSAASFTRMPFCLCGGGSKRTSFSCWRCSTPSAASATASSGFFFAFMMSGSFT